MGRGHTFFGLCMHEAGRGTVRLANAWYWPFAVPIIALVGYLYGDSLTLGFSPDLGKGGALIGLAASAVAVAWLLLFVIMLIGAPGRLDAAAQAKIRALAAEVDERRVAQASDLALVLPAADASARSSYSIAVNNVGDNILRDCQISVQFYGDAWLVPGPKLVPVPVPVSDVFALRPGESRTVALLQERPEAPGAALVIERYRENAGAWVPAAIRPELAPGSYTIKVMAFSADTGPAQLHLRLIHQPGRWSLRRAFEPGR